MPFGARSIPHFGEETPRKNHNDESIRQEETGYSIGASPPPSSERTPIFREDEVMKIHTRLFDTKWIQQDVLSNGSRLGSSDAQSVADLGNCCELVRKIKLAPSRKVTSSPFPFLA